MPEPPRLLRPRPLSRACPSQADSTRPTHSRASRPRSPVRHAGPRFPQRGVPKQRSWCSLRRRRGTARLNQADSTPPGPTHRAARPSQDHRLGTRNRDHRGRACPSNDHGGLLRSRRGTAPPQPGRLNPTRPDSTRRIPAKITGSARETAITAAERAQATIMAGCFRGRHGMAHLNQAASTSPGRPTRSLRVPAKITDRARRTAISAAECAQATIMVACLEADAARPHLNQTDSTPPGPTPRSASRPRSPARHAKPRSPRRSVPKQRSWRAASEADTEWPTSTRPTRPHPAARLAACASQPRSPIGRAEPRSPRRRVPKQRSWRDRSGKRRGAAPPQPGQLAPTRLTARASQPRSPVGHAEPRSSRLSVPKQRSWCRATAGERPVIGGHDHRPSARRHGDRGAGQA